MKSTVLVTGAAGFIGREVVVDLMQRGSRVISLVRSQQGKVPGDVIVIQDLTSDQVDRDDILSSVDAVVHLAARAHRMGDANTQEYLRANGDATQRLATKAYAAGVKHFVLVSTAKVFGEGRDKPYSESDPPAPQDGYAASKLAAEQAVIDVCRNGRMNYTIIRPPLVYGSGARANFADLIDIVRTGLVLPFGGIKNARSLIHRTNLSDAICRVVLAPAAYNDLFVVTDGPPVSTADMIRAISRYSNSRTRLVNVPQRLIAYAMSIAGQSGRYHRLTSSFSLDDTRFRQRFSWTPPISFEQGIAESVGYVPQ